MIASVNGVLAADITAVDGVTSIASVIGQEWAGNGSSTTWSPTDKTAGWTLSGGNLIATYSSASGLHSIRASSGCGTTLKVVWAVRWTSFVAGVMYVGVTTTSQAITAIGSPYLLVQTNGETIQAGGSGSGASLGAISANDITMYAQDGATGQIWVGRNGTWSGDPEAGTGEAYDFSSIADYRALLQSFNDAQMDLLVGTDYPYSMPAGWSSL